ncbi:hypothetical protein [Lysinibacillus sp. 3P01SB]|uniref:hypothetical protein n=1 Tax=Lysinibacillus sp. 3P01SB TaxID=3132284 RepID=UPI0039A74AE1
MDFFYREHLEDVIESKTFKLTTESRDRINFIAHVLEMKQGDVLELLIDHLYSDEKMHEYIIAKSFENPLSFYQLQSEMADNFANYIREQEINNGSSKDEVFHSFLNTLQTFLMVETTFLHQCMEENKKLNKFFGQSYDAILFMRIFPYWAKEMFQIYQDISNFMDINEENLLFLNALAVKLDPVKYIAIRLDTTQTLVQSMVEQILKEENGLLELWQKFNLEVVSRFKGDINFPKIYKYITEKDTNQYDNLVKILNKMLENVEKMANPFKSTFFL